VVDGELAEAKQAIIPGRMIVGVVVERGAGVALPAMGACVGIGWIGLTCGACRYCISGRENLSDTARFTSYQIHGGSAQRTIADARCCFPIPAGYDDVKRRCYAQG
jgi:propanol-preferring alcohol dehydrogenase